MTCFPCRSCVHPRALLLILCEQDSLLLNLPFGGAVLKALGGTTDDEISSILEDIRKKAVDTDVVCFVALFNTQIAPSGRAQGLGTR